MDTKVDKKVINYEKQTPASMKTFGGIGYVISLIPFVNIASPILVGIAWYQMGSKTGKGLFKATGVFMIITFVVAVGFIVSFAAILLPVFIAALAGGGVPGFDPAVLVSSMLGSLLVSAGFALILGVLGLVAFILELVSHFRAAGLYRNKWFSRAAWLRIIAVILMFVVIGVTIATTSFAVMSPMQFDTLLSTMFLLVIPLAVVGLLSSVFSAVAFFTLGEEIPPPPPPV